MNEFERKRPTVPEGMRDLSICLNCNKESVALVEWEEYGEKDWEVLLRCGNCERYYMGIFDQDTVEVYDDILDFQSEIIANELKWLFRANMSEDVERFVGALAAGAILPEDFKTNN